MHFIADWEFWIIKDKILAFQHVMAAEFQNSATFYVPQRMGYHTATLILNATDCAELSNEARFGGIARYDFNEAGKCLAFGMPTAAGFHSTRSVEAVFDIYLKTFCDVRTKTMGKRIEKLEKIKDGKAVPSAKVLRTLREIKDLDRNPLAHPECTLDMIEAKALFDLSGIAIHAMFRDLNRVSKANENGGN